MNAVYLLTSSLLFAVMPGDDRAADSAPVLAPPVVQPADSPAPGQNSSALEPVLSPRAAAKLVEDVRQLKEDAAKSQEQIRQLELRIAELERQLPAKQGAQPREVGAFPTMGTLVLDNRTLFAHTVSVNGLLISVAPGRTTIDIPVGTATVYMPYHERPKQFGLDRWHRSGQHYEMLITINDQ